MNRTGMTLIVIPALLLCILGFNLSNAVSTNDVMKNIPVNGTISPKGCNVIKGTIVNEQVNLLKTRTCYYDNYKFLITYAPHRGCVEMIGSWKDSEKNKIFEFPTICDEPNSATSNELGLGYYFSPLQQMKLGVPLNDITCKDYSLQLVTNPSSQMAVCVKQATAQKLVDRGWAMRSSS